MQTAVDVSLGRGRVRILGTIQGFVPDADRVREAFAAWRPDVVALGVPPEDLAALDGIAAEGGALPEDASGLDEHAERLMQHLRRFGETRIPSPDLEAAHALATSHGLEVAALDLDDETHAEAYVRSVGFRHVWRAGRMQKRLLGRSFDHVQDPHELACLWDEGQNALAPLQKVEALREEHMAERLRALAEGGARVLAVLPVGRFAGVAAALEETAGEAL